jgi:hypothetical protein
MTSACHGPFGIGVVDPNTARDPVRSRSIRPAESIQWRRSRALGKPWAGRLVNGVRLPSEGRLFFTWDPVKKRSPNRAYRRYGTDRLIRVL